MHLFPSPVIRRPRNNLVVPIPQASLWDSMSFSFLWGYEYHLPAWDDALSGNAYLTASGTPALSGAGQRACAFTTTFNGASYLYRADEAALRVPTTSGSAFTISAWVKLSNLTGDHVVFSKRSVGDIEYELKYDSTVQRWTWLVHNAAGLLYTTISATRPTAGVWYLLIADYSRNPISPGIALTINAAEPRVSFNVTSFASVGGNEFRIGSGPTGFLTGSIEDVSFWSRLLNVAERAALMGRAMIDLGAVINASADGGGIPEYPVNSAPDAPLDFALDVTGANPVLSWVNDAPNSIAIEVQRDDGAGFVSIAQPYLDDAWTDEDVTLPASVTYRIRSINPFGASGWSAELSTASGSSSLADADGSLSDADGSLTES